VEMKRGNEDLLGPRMSCPDRHRNESYTKVTEKKNSAGITGLFFGLGGFGGCGGWWGGGFGWGGCVGWFFLGGVFEGARKVELGWGSKA